MKILDGKNSFPLLSKIFVISKQYPPQQSQETLFPQCFLLFVCFLRATSLCISTFLYTNTLAIEYILYLSVLNRQGGRRQKTQALPQSLPCLKDREQITRHHTINQSSDPPLQFRLFWLSLRLLCFHTTDQKSSLGGIVQAVKENRPSSQRNSSLQYQHK